MELEVSRRECRTLEREDKREHLNKKKKIPRIVANRLDLWRKGRKIYFKHLEKLKGLVVELRDQGELRSFISLCKNLIHRDNM